MPDIEPNPIATRAEPLEIAYKKTGKGEGDTLESFIEQITGDIEADVKDRNTFSRKAVTAYQLRRGQIGKKDKNFPFINSSDQRYPIPEYQIRKKRSGYTAVLWDTPKVVRYAPGEGCDSSAKDRLEWFMNWLFRSYMNKMYEKSGASADKMLEQGKSFIKVTWGRHTEWRTKVFLKEDGDKLKALVRMIKLKAWQAQQQQQTQGQLQPVQTQQQATAPTPPAQPDPKEMEPTRDDLLEAFAQAQQIDPDNKEYRKQAESTIDQYLDGKDIITWMQEVVKYNGPLVEPIPENQSVIYPLNSTCVEDAERVCHESFYNRRELLQESEENGGKFKHVQELIDAYPRGYAPLSDDSLDMEAARAAAEGIKQVAEYENEYKIWEVFCWIPRKHISRFVGIGGNDETPVRAVLTYCPIADAKNIEPLRLEELPYDHQQWPIHEANYNYRIARAQDAQGIPELIDPFVREYNTSKNASIDRTTITMSPPTLIWDQAGIRPQQFRQVGQAMTTGIPPEKAIYIPTYPNLKDGFETDAESAMQWCDRIIGTTDASPFADRVTSPTRREVDVSQMPSSAFDHYEHSIWLSVWGRVFGQVHSLIRQFWFLEKKEFQFARTDKPDEKVTIQAKDFDGKWIISAGGDPSRGDPQLELQKYMIGLQMAVQMGQVGLAIKLYRLIVLCYSKLLGYAEAAEILESEQAYTKVQQAVQQAAKAEVVRKLEGKRPARKAKIIQPPGAPQSMLAT